MILFESDYFKYSTAIVDYETTNQSFLELAAKYHKAGYSNSLFILTLLNPDLQGVDPFSPTLTQEQKVAIAIECENNPFYFLREVCRLPPNAGIEPVRYRASRGNIAATWAFCCAIDFILIQPRQTGKSVGIDCIMVWALYLASDNTRINLVTKDAALRTSNIERLQMIKDLLPGYLYIKDKTDSANKIGMTYNTRNNKYSTAVAQMSEAAATNVGRGQTSPIFHIDEGPFISHIGVLLPAALAAGTAARDHARKVGALNCTIFTTTAGKKDDRDGKVIYKLIEESANWTEAWFDLKDKAELHDVVYKASHGIYKRIYMEFSHTQLGFDDQWLLNALAQSGATGDDADRDFFNRWTSGSLQSPLSIQLNETIRDSKREPVWTQVTPQGYTIYWYIEKSLVKEYLKNNNVLLGLDTSEAVGRDDCGLVFTDAMSLETIGSATVNETNIASFAKYVGELLITHLKLLLVIERKSTATPIIDIITTMLLAAGMNPFKRIYNTVIQDRVSYPTAYDEVMKASNSRMSRMIVDKYRKHFGFVTTAQSRHELYRDVLQNNAKLGGSRVYDDKLIMQITSLVIKNGRIDHTNSGHDDLVIAWLLNGWFLTNGLNMDFYGINPMRVLSRTSVVNNDITPEEEYKQETVIRLRKDIEEVKQDLIACKDMGRRMLLAGRLGRLVDKSAGLLPEAISLDAILKETAEKSNVTRLSNRAYRHKRAA